MQTSGSEAVRREDRSMISSGAGIRVRSIFVSGRSIIITILPGAIPGSTDV